MSSVSFGSLLRLVRSRTKGTEVAREASISYVYLLDLEKGARPVPSDRVLRKLASRLPFGPGERELFFDLAAEEKQTVPLDVADYLIANKEVVELLRDLNNRRIDAQKVCACIKTAMLNMEDTHE